MIAAMDKNKLMDNMLYASLILMVGSSTAGILYMTFSTAFMDGIHVSVLQFISGTSLLVANVMGLTGMIFWSTTRYLEKQDGDG